MKSGNHDAADLQDVWDRGMAPRLPRRDARGSEAQDRGREGREDEEAERQTAVQTMTERRVALLALREPTEAMESAAFAADLDIYWSYEADGRPGGPKDVWRAMIDAAIAVTVGDQAIAEIVPGPISAPAIVNENLVPIDALLDAACAHYGPDIDRERLKATIADVIAPPYVIQATNEAANVCRGTAAHCDRAAAQFRPPSLTPNEMQAVMHVGQAEVVRAVGAAILSRVGLPFDDLMPNSDQRRQNPRGRGLVRGARSERISAGIARR
jgi:hypothetical protein